MDFSPSSGSGFLSSDTILGSTSSAMLANALQDAQSQLQLFFSSPNSAQQLGFVFDITNYQAVQTLLENVVSEAFTFPQVQVLNDELMNGARGAYSSDRNAIYLAASLLETDDLTGMQGTLIEEYGHYVDTLLNPGEDTAGDEGELFKTVVLGDVLDEAELLRIQTEDDFGIITLDGVAIAVEQDNTLNTARNVGTLIGTRTFSDFIGTSDTNDYYRFNVTATSNFSLALNGLTADADVQLLNSAGVIIQRSTASGTNPESITRTLTAGTYYARVHRYSGSTNYNLTLSVFAIPTIPDNAGNTIATARNIGTLTGSRSFQDFVGTSDTNDYYRFNVTATSNFTLALNGLTADADVQLLNSAGVVIQYATASGTNPESITRTLTAGTYYARVHPFSGSTNYNLTLSASAIPTIPDNAGNTITTARNIGTLTGSRFFQDFVGTSDTNDYYRFNVTATSNFSLALNGLTADADVQLLNSAGVVIQRSIASGTNPESITRTLTAGTYYARVHPFSGSTNYNLSLSANPLRQFNSTYGYGLVNAAAAVARAIGQSTPFANVTNLGGNNWGNDLVNAPEAWARGYTGQGVVVAVIDSGVDINHQDLRNNIWTNSREIAGNGIDDDRNGYVDDIYGWNFGVGQNNNNVLPGTTSSGQGHGTHVAGTIAAANNGIGMTGVAHGARIMSLRMGNVDNNGRFTNGGSLAEAIRYAVDNGARVINMSLGWPDSSDLRSALQYAADRNVITVSASGNASSPSPGNPARYATQWGLSVGAVDRNRLIASFSNRAGSNSQMQHVMAPGVTVYSTLPGNRYGFQNGTSMATPHTAGVVALMLSANRNLTSAQVRSIVTGTATRLA